MNPCTALSALMSPTVHGCVLVMLVTAMPLSASQRLEGVVVDRTGAAVKAAEIRIDGQAGAKAITDDSGEFGFEAGAFRGLVLEVTAPGFSAVRIRLEDSAKPLLIVLDRVRIEEAITVTAGRVPMRLEETPASVVVITAEDLRTTAAVTLDDSLRQVPGFTLFRRSGSSVANPTTQGVSLRGVGASGAGRALVLDDGIPLNDPFGGWVYWGRVPREALRQVEVLRGGGSDLWGSGALGGVVHLLRRDEKGPAISLKGSYGSSDTPELSLYAGRAGERWRFSGAAEAIRTAGYRVVSAPERGPVDTPADSERTSVDLTLERRWRNESARVFLRGSRFDEERGNGTPLQTNETEIEQITLGGDLFVREIQLSVRAYGSRQDYFQSFSAIAAGRAGESLTRLQHVPSEASGFSLQASTEVGSMHGIVSGVDIRSVKGKSDERGFGFAETFSSSGGTQSSLGAFLGDVIRVSERLSLTAAIRLDQWRNHDASRTAGSERVALETRQEDALSPRVSAHYRLNDHWSMAVSAYRAFRAPTLNELYRGFRVGNVVTDANEALEAETLTGFEAGVTAFSPGDRSRVRAMWFRAEVDDPIANVTRSITPSLISRQRQNLGSTLSQGFELEGQVRPRAGWTLSAGYLFVKAEVKRSPGSEELVGLAVPQVPENQATLQMRYGTSAFAAAVQARWSDEQFDDDRNLFRLESYFAIDALVSRTVGRGIELFAAGENLTDERYETGRTPVTTVGPPRSLRLGVRVRWPER
ncbi:MAG TPA: TonB-dependent receptor [Thermoanaerobaculia bacterium]|nr:TonB-dependent receptor [Thermoanaerobaculia bacterium]